MTTLNRLTNLMSLVALAASTLMADASLTFVRRDANTVAVMLRSSEPVAGLQMTVVASSSISIGSVSGSVASEWIFASNLLNANELRMVVIGKTRTEFTSGSTEIARLTISATGDANEYSLRLMQVVASTSNGEEITTSAFDLTWDGSFDPDAAVGFSLAGNYPNPFNPSTTIGYSIDRATDVRLSVYDMLGREVKVLVDEFQSAGTHRATWTIERGTTATGTYFARLVIGDRSQVARMVVAQ